jgi:MscS family membrane protein
MPATAAARARLLLCVTIVFACAATPVARGQGLLPHRAPPDTTHDRGAAAPHRASRAVETSPASPRASVQRYLDLSRAGDYGAAGAYLDLPDSTTDARARLARELRAVLDRYLLLDPEDISPLASGDTTDGLRVTAEQLGTIPMGDGSNQPVRLVRDTVNGEPAWLFSHATVLRIPSWYASLGDRWVLEHLPASLLRRGPLDLLRWQWAALPLLLALAWMAGWVATRILLPVLKRGAQRTSSSWDDAVVLRIAGPLRATCRLAALDAGLPLLGLYKAAETTGFRIVKVGFLLVFFWALWRLVDVARHLLGQSLWARNVPASRSLLPLGARSAKVVVAAIAAVASLSLLGFPVASLLAGLGLGGLALALAAQKTVENLFGAFSIGIDQPFREGDFVKIEDFVGTVEAIGLRSSRFRTLDRTIITIPNGKLADMRLESFTVRDRLRLAMTIGLVYETTGAQMRQALAGFERVLRAHPKIWPDAVVVRFGAFADSSLNIDIMAWFQTADWSEFQAIRQEILLQFMEVVEAAGSSFAFPTQTLHVASLPAGAPDDEVDRDDGNADGESPARAAS